MVPAWFKGKGKKGGAEPPKGTGAKAPSKPSPVSVTSLLTEDLILVRPALQDKNQLVENLVERLCSVKSLPSPRLLLQKVLEREQGISTTLDTGLSLPHARLDGIEDITAVLGLVPQGVPDPRQPDLVIRAMFLFFSPNTPESFPRHLQVLRSVSALFQPALIDQLLAAGTTAQVLSLIRKSDSKT